MISLKKTMEAFDYRVMFEAAVESYRAAIESLEKHTVRVDLERIATHRSRLLELGKRLNLSEIRPEMLQKHSADLDGELGLYQTDIELLLVNAGNDFREVVAVLAETTEKLSERETSQGAQLSRISGGLETIARIDDVVRLRTQLNQYVLELRACIDQMSKQTEGAIQELQREITSFQKRLERVQVEASTDALTGIANRRGAGKEIATRINEHREFGVLLFDMNEFKQINDSHGHAAGDCVLRIVAQRLQGQVRKDDLVCRWGGDEFIVVYSGLGPELKERAAELASRVAGKVRISVGGTEQEVTIGTGVGWAEYVLGESVEELIARADKVLYRSKGQRINQSLSEAADRQLLTIAPKADAAEPNPGNSGSKEELDHSYPMDATTRLTGMDAAKAAMGPLSARDSTYYACLFGFRRSTTVNAHYGYPATEELLPFLRDKLMSTQFNGQLFRGPGASIVALVKSQSGPDILEQEMDLLIGVSWENHLQQKKRASKLAVGARGKVIALKLGIPAVLRAMDGFLMVHQVSEDLAMAR